MAVQPEPSPTTRSPHAVHTPETAQHSNHSKIPHSSLLIFIQSPPQIRFLIISCRKLFCSLLTYVCVPCYEPSCQNYFPTEIIFKFVFAKILHRHLKRDDNCLTLNSQYHHIQCTFFSYKIMFYVNSFCDKPFYKATQNIGQHELHL